MKAYKSFFLSFGADKFYFQRVETNNGGSEVSVYINSVSESNTCFYLNAIQVSYVEDLKSGTIEVFDYYDTSKTSPESFLTVF